MGSASQHNTSRSARLTGSGAAIAAGLVTLTLLGGLVRLWAIRGDFWLDEIWSWELARGVASPLEILTAIHHDNNHVLNSLFIRLLGDCDHWSAYRLLSFATGTASVVLAGLIGLRRGRLEGFTAACLIAVSYLQMLYASEARGYAPAVFSALGAWIALLSFLQTRRTRYAVVFVVASVCGFLSHLTFVHFYLGAMIFSSLVIVRSRESGGPRPALIAWLQCHAAPILFLVVLWWLDIRHITVAGGPELELSDVLRRVVALSLGGPESGALAWVICAAASAIGLLGLVMLARSGSQEWAFYLTVIVISPTLVLFVVRPEFLYARYFLICATFALMLGAFFLAEVGRRGRWGVAVYLVVMVLVVGGNGRRIGGLLRDGRGQYLAALQYMAAQTAGPVIEIGGDDDFRNGKMVRFYSRYLPPNKPVRFVTREEWTRNGPEWLLLHRQAPDYEPEQRIEAFFGLPYELQREFRYAGVSGFHWFVYRRAEQP